MTIAKGRTNCQSERELVLQGFYEQLKILEDSQIEQENIFKAKLYDIVSDCSLYEEEGYTLKRPWTEHLQELEERHIRIRRSVFIGLYSFWEVSLMDMANTYIPTKVAIARNSKKSNNFGTSDYIKLIYGNTLPLSVFLIDNNVREFRNYLVHGTLTKKREALINALVNSHTELCVKAYGNVYFISDYKGIIELLTMLSRELDHAENQILKLKTTK